MNLLVALVLQMVDVLLKIFFKKKGGKQEKGSKYRTFLAGFKLDAPKSSHASSDSRLT